MGPIAVFDKAPAGLIRELEGGPRVLLLKIARAA
jgi:hypothetical protein